MENPNIDLTIGQLDYLLELVTQSVALSLMTLDKLENAKLRSHLELRINTNRAFLTYLRAKKYEAATFVSAKSH